MNMDYQRFKGGLVRNIRQIGRVHSFISDKGCANADKSIDFIYLYISTE